MAVRTSRDRQKFDANARIPETLTSHLRESLLQLDSGPKEDYLKTEVFSKFISDETLPAIARRNAAIRKWLATERNNEATNVRLLTLHEEYNILPRVSWRSFRDTVRRFITDVIGEVPAWDSVEGNLGGFSGGASTSRQRTMSHPAQKYLGQADITEAALPYFEELLNDSEVWKLMRGSDEVRIVPGNVLFTVPKNTEIDRCACKEPDLNMYLQRGFGAVIRRSLKRVGIDLNDQSRNRTLARQGSLDGTLATLDLSSASDSISSELVYQFLPDLWFTTLNALRSPVTVIDGEVHVNEMFSSMGNGFTFELESLIFYCVSRAVAYHLGISGVISVYGDDIIVPVDIAELLSFVLGVLGFEVNTKKSFYTGPFRESCGGHYHNGLDITPFYVKAPLEKLTDLIRVCNQLRRWATSDGLEILDPRVYRIWRKLASHVPIRFWGGHDTNSTTQLVSYTVPTKPYKLMSRTRKKFLSEEGKYLLWLDSGRKRSTGITEDVISELVTVTSYRAVPARGYFHRGLVPCFYEEVMAE